MVRRSFLIMFSDHKRKKTSCLIDMCKENEEIKARTERLIDEIHGMFSRSNLPKDEHPNLRNTMQQCIKEEVCLITCL